MKDIFFTILTIWILYRIWNAVQLSNSKNSFNKQTTQKKEGDVSIDHIPQKRNKHSNSEGEYVDYEEVKK
ncbi:MAG: hypothetical protein IT235_00120 [Bacteroidia bacterium]|nr:hypothetical protein [Bacteroidia bacterium]